MTNIAELFELVNEIILILGTVLDVSSISKLIAVFVSIARNNGIGKALL